MTTKKILITGANSYIGMSFEKWLAQWPDEYILNPNPRTVDAMMKLDLPAGVEIEIKLNN